MSPERAAWALAVGAVAVTAAWAYDASSPVSATVAATRGLGLAAFGTLVASLAVRPALGPRAARWRRAFGLSAFGLVVAHAATAGALGAIEDPALLVYEPHLRAGFTAALALGLLAATSFPRWWSPPHWRILHRAVYGASGLAALHVAGSPHVDPRIAVIAPAVVLGLLVARLWPRRRPRVSARCRRY